VRDLHTDAFGAHVVGAASLSVEVDDAGGISHVASEPADVDLAPLLGARIGFGFRGQVKELLVALTGTPLGFLVDDLNGAPAPAAYARVREEKLDGTATVMTAPPTSDESPRATQTDVCAGWRADGLPARERERGRPMPFLTDPPVPPSLEEDDELAWHRLPPLPPRHGRRLRRLDIWRDADTVHADAMFRDYSVDPDGTERVVHEYGATATLAGDGLRIVELTADPRGLPFPTDCPLAAGSARFLLGEPVGALRTSVRELSRGPASCTHLNDLFRSLADVATLIELLPS
jgi:hypothetical protein